MIFAKEAIQTYPKEYLRGTSNMADYPNQLQAFDLKTTDTAVRNHLETKYIDHPTRGPYMKSRVLYEDVQEEIDEQFSLELFGQFCESCPYLEKWSRGYNGSYRYRIIENEL